MLPIFTVPFLGINKRVLQQTNRDDVGVYPAAGPKTGKM